MLCLSYHSNFIGIALDENAFVNPIWSGGGGGGIFAPPLDFSLY